MFPRNLEYAPLPACQIQSTTFIPGNKLADITTCADLASPETRNTQNWGTTSIGLATASGRAGLRAAGKQPACRSNRSEAEQALEMECQARS